MTPAPRMSISEARLRIAEMTAKHHADSEEFYRQQTKGLGDVLMEIIIALDVPMEERPEGKALLFGSWTREAILAALSRQAEKETA